MADGAAAAKAQLFAPGGLANFVAAAGRRLAPATRTARASPRPWPRRSWPRTRKPTPGRSSRGSRRRWPTAPPPARPRRRSPALRAPRARAAFAAQGGVALLAARLNDAGGGAQLKYEVAFSLWCLSFEEDAPDDFVRSHAVEALCAAPPAAPREKV